MFRPYIKRTYILVLVAMINLLLVYISYQSYSFTKSKDYELKIEAATIMKNALDLTKGLDNPKDIDRFKSGLVGVDSTSSQMTTKRGFLESKVATTNPNFAAVFIDWFSAIGISSDISNVNFHEVSFRGVVFKDVIICGKRIFGTVRVKSFIEGIISEENENSTNFLASLSCN